MHGKCLEWDEIVHEKFNEIVKLGWWFPHLANAIKFLKYSYIVLLSKFSCLIYSWIVNNYEISFGW